LNTVLRVEADKLHESSIGYSRGHQKGLLSAVSVGFFLILVGVLFISTPSLADKVGTFVNHFHTVQVGNTNIYIPAPEHPGDHIDIYLAARQFSLVWGVFLIVMLGARFLFDSPFRRKAQNLGNIVFWLGAAYLIQTFLVAPTEAFPQTIDVTKWFDFWAAIIMLIGVSLIARAIFLATARLRTV
jgi:hypothetical protein